MDSPTLCRGESRRKGSAVTSPETNLIQFRAAEQLLEARDARGAVNLLDNVIEEHPEHRGARLLRARAYFLEARLQSAEQEFQWVLEREPDNAFAHFALARTLQRSSRDDEARAHFKLAAALNPRPDFVEAAGFDNFEPPEPGATDLGN
ncbi:tetratricopeptide repeat protein [Streptomyces sp. 891-h]|uniref:tetratricopeptide repeat protein n=1 Tax=unclassified Streptomyces TaxID=2593676 RepID=UPI001FAAF5CD|nr:tetratricopeptide repeat protein [Streptomyces sp. 891-h]UNZ19981.1 tetratricopeptide repeat protein [Streptomyces sp. 891-h]